MVGRSLCIALVLALASCHQNASPLQPLQQGGKHILFIGNSLTYVNDLPGTLSALAASGGDTIRVLTVAHPNFAVIDHANGQSNAVDAIRLGGWNLVVLQQGPTSQQLYRDTLILATRLLDPAIRAAGARSAQLMTWPSANERHLFDAVRTSCELAASAVGGVFIPAGAAWRAAWLADPQLALYGSDGFHPSELGTYLAALVLYESITHKDARALPARAVVNGRVLGVPEPTIRLLQRIAHETVRSQRGLTSHASEERRSPM